MKKLIVLLFLPILLLSSCSMEPTIPDNSSTFQQFSDHKQAYQKTVEYFSTLEFDAMVSRNDYYSIEGSESFEGLYLQNMQNLSLSACENESIAELFRGSNVKLVDWIIREDLKICAFDMCIPGKNFDYGIYYTSGDSPIYFGDPSIELTPSGNGFSYEKKASYGAKFTYYTEKIDEHYYYYEIA